MEEKPNGQSEEKEGQEKNPQPPPPPSPEEKTDTQSLNHPNQHDDPSTEQQQPAVPSRFVRILHFFSKSEWVMVLLTAVIVFLTAVIAGTGVVGIILVIKSGDDTKKMVAAAQQQACAAQHFADTAGLINGNINQAVGKLNLQASALKDSAAQTRRLAKDTEVSTSLAQQSLHVSEQAYIFPELVVTVGQHDCFLGNTITLASCASFRYRNFGRTPAINVVVTGQLYVGGVSPAVLAAMVPPAHDDTHGITIAANDSKSQSIYGVRGDPATTRGNVNARYFLVGYIQYKTIFQEWQVAPFCISAPINPTPTHHDPVECQKPKTQANQNQTPN